ncbi:serine hydrolase [Pleomorphovibrio marinus]|uniref:serine hydrolase n=1 Tax=Pleomorphovibrio marinus TaxID=2164132 RepID=UPI000E0B3687|nr:serine hydrolase [Pleomorphovibrio marinus]
MLKFPFYPSLFSLAHFGVLCISLLLTSVTLSTAQHSKLKQFLKALPEEIEVSLQVNKEDESLLYAQNENKQIPSASIIKVPILIFLFMEVDKGSLDLDEKVVLEEKDKVGGAGMLRENPDGSSFTWRYLATEMIRISDNTATNMLINRLGRTRIQTWLEEEGFKHTILDRLMMDFEAIAEGRQNFTSPNDTNRLFMGLYNGQWLTENSKVEALFMLKNCADNTCIPGQLPPGVEIAHKTGTLDYVRGDAGIVFGTSPIFLSVFVEGFKELTEAESIIAEISRIVFEELEE